jgi:plastocyanin
MGFALPARRRLGAALLVSAAVSGTCLATVDALAAPVVRAQAASTVEATAANQFSPKTLTVPVGTTVTWTNPQSGFHTVTGGTPTAKDTSKMNAPLSFKTFEATFDKAGTYPYFCEPHASSGMTGEIVVTAKGAPAPGGSASATPKGAKSPTAGPSESSTAASSQTPRPVEGEEDGEGDEGEGEHEVIPGVDDNDVIKRIEAEEASNDKQVKGFQTLLWAMIAAMVALGIALFLSTRPRRANR